jgi:hypothetical protein
MLCIKLSHPDDGSSGKIHYFAENNTVFSNFFVMSHSSREKYCYLTLYVPKKLKLG